MRNRGGMAGRRQAQTGAARFLAPVAGWHDVSSADGGQGQAQEMVNFWPTARGVQIRGGSVEYADAGERIDRIFEHSSPTGRILFGTSASRLYNLDRLSTGDDTHARAHGFSNGDWSTSQVTTSGGTFLIGFNGEDAGIYYEDRIRPYIDGANKLFTISFDALTEEFTAGDTVTGATSGTTGTLRIATTPASSTAGSLYIESSASSLTFIDNETITGAASGSATIDGTSATEISSPPSVSGVDTANINYVWQFKQRVFLIEKDSMSAWYLPVDSFGGTASEINLGSVFGLGGNLLFGVNWSIDSGEGLDDVCLFVTTEGEIAVYVGTDPSSASTWALRGVYRIPKPVNKHAGVKVGADVVILTEGGMFSVSRIVQGGIGTVEGSALSQPIENTWIDAVGAQTTVKRMTAEFWPEKSLMIVGAPNDSSVSVSIRKRGFAFHTQTGAWSEIRAWEMIAVKLSGEILYFSDADGKVFKANETGQDDGDEILAWCYCTPQSLGGFRARAIEVAIDYDGSITTISPRAISEGGTALADSDEDFSSIDNVADAEGRTLAPGVYVTSDTTNANTLELLGFTLRYESSRRF
ncbi:MAG: hypothetical protein AAF401_11285 [Pseudomonadota bacterium]